MNRARRNARRARAEARKAWARASSAQHPDAESKLAAALALAHRARGLAARFTAPDPPSRELFAIVAERSPRLLESDYVPVLRLIASLPKVRPIRDWEPRAKGRESRFQSLVAHLFATCPVPSILWRGFFDDERDALAPLIVWVASGGSLFQYAKARFPIPLTRRMCHLALAMRSESSLLRAMRKAEVLALGGSSALAEAWAKSVDGAALGTREEEAFYLSLLEWLAVRPHRAEDVAAILDYAGHRHREDAAFSMKGRTVDAFLRDARAWHRELARARAIAQTTLPSSGFAPMALERVAPKRVVWRVDEITTTRDLHEEGRRMGHCVYSYARAVQTGGTSIWSMTMEDGTGPTGRWAMLTIEVRNHLRAIVQARGRFNRMPTNEEARILARWAAANGLTLT